jgi:hypothetical protein
MKIEELLCLRVSRTAEKVSEVLTGHNMATKATAQLTVLFLLANEDRLIEIEARKNPVTLGWVYDEDASHVVYRNADGYHIAELSELKALVEKLAKQKYIKTDTPIPFGVVKPEDGSTLYYIPEEEFLTITKKIFE